MRRASLGYCDFVFEFSPNVQTLSLRERDVLIAMLSGPHLFLISSIDAHQ